MSRRVLQVFGPVDGGVPDHVKQLSEGLRRRGWEVEVAGPEASVAAQALRDQGVPLHPMVLERAPGPADVRAVRELRRLDGARRYDIVHAHSSKAGGLVRGALPRSHRLFYTPNCWAFSASFGFLSGVQRQVYRAAEQALVPRTGTLIAASEWERREGERNLRGAGRKLRVVHNAVPPCPAAAPDPEVLAFKGDGLLAASVSRLAAQKDPAAIVRAAAVLKRRGQLSFRIAVIGNGDLRGEVERAIAEHGLGEDLRVFPFRGGAFPYLAALDLFVLPSLWESFPISVLEAMSCGRPVLATDVGGTGEAVRPGVTGELVAPGDAEGLAGAMARMLADPDRLAAYGRAGAAAHAERFAVDPMVDAIAGHYEAALARG